MTKIRSMYYSVAAFAAIVLNAILFVCANTNSCWMVYQPEDDKELYEYAAYSFLFSLLPLCLVIIIGCAVNMVIEGILMVIPFMLIRKFSGGFHLNSSAVCFVSSTALLSLFIFIVKFVTISAQIPLFTGGVVLAAIQIFLCSPIDNEARKLSEKETVTFRTVARVYVILTCVKQWRFSVPVGAGIIITALLQLPCLFTRKCSAT